MGDRAVIRGAGALIYSRTTGRYLFLLRSGAKYAGTWGLVGGKIEDHETPIDGLHREIREEIGIDLCDHVVAPIEEFISEDKHFHYKTYVILVNAEFVPTLNQEHNGYAWVDIEHIPKPQHPGLWNMLAPTRKLMFGS